MSHISLSQQGASPFQNLMGHNSEILKQWNALEYAFLNSPTFTWQLKEEVRKVLAFINQCEYCMSKGNPSLKIEDEKTSKAVQFAKLWKNHREITEEHISFLKNSFTEAEISELCALISFFCASQQFGASLGLKACSY